MSSRLQLSSRAPSSLDLLFLHQMNIVGVTALRLSPEDWVVAMETALLVIIIVGRWLMPKGELTRDQLSALLLAHLGTASDIVDFLTILAEGEASESGSFVFAVLAIWTWSLCQFPFVVTHTTEELASSSESTRDVKDVHDGHVDPDKKMHRFQVKRKIKRALAVLVETEAWAIFVSVLMQDGPFFIMRLISIFKFHVVTYTNYFFTCKNALLLVLQLYRLNSICSEYKKNNQGSKITVIPAGDGQQKVGTMPAHTRLSTLYNSERLWPTNSKAAAKPISILPS